MIEKGKKSTAPIPVTRTIVEPDLDGCSVGFMFQGKHPNWTKPELDHPERDGEPWLPRVSQPRGKGQR